MYAGGFHSEYHIFLSAKEQESDQVGWRTWVYFAAIVLAAVGSIVAQIQDRKRHLDAYKYKSRFSPYESYQQMRERYQRPQKNESKDGYSDLDNSADQSKDD